MAAVGALTGMAIGLSHYVGILFLNLVIVTLLISGVVGYARLRLNAHTPAQVYGGFALGFISVSALFVFSF
jgi:membrane-associated phospholipid phosphatase